MTTLLPGQTGGYVVKGLAKSETACTMIMLIKCVDASTFDLSKAGYSPVTDESQQTNRSLPGPEAADQRGFNEHADGGHRESVREHAPLTRDGDDEAHAERLSFIRHCRGLDMTLDEIRVLLRFKDAPTENCLEVNELLDEHIGHVAERIKELRQLEKQLKSLREACLGGQEAQHCGILNELTEIAKSPSSPLGREGHVHGAHSASGARKAAHKH